MVHCRIDLLTHSIIDVDFNLSTRIIAGTGSQITKPGEAATSCPTYTAYQLEEGSLKLLGTKNVPNNVVSVLKLRFLAKGGTEFICGEFKPETMSRFFHRFFEGVFWKVILQIAKKCSEKSTWIPKCQFLIYKTLAKIAPRVIQFAPICTPTNQSLESLWEYHSIRKQNKWYPCHR